MNKKIVLLFVFLMLLLCVVSCNDKSNSEIQEKGILYRSIPMGIIEDDGYIKVSFILTHQFFKIKEDQENLGYITKIKEAIAKKEPLRLLLKPETNEIIKVESPTSGDIRYFDLFNPKKELVPSPSLAIGVILGKEALDQLFAKIKSEACTDTSIVKDTCITFRYPVDGCFARAHKMRKIVENNNYFCEKQFVYGYLRAKDKEKDCCVEWSYHVAVLVKYQDSIGAVIKKLIIDPSLFKNGPVTAETWRAACSEASCGDTYISSYSTVPGNVYFVNEQGDYHLYDNHYINTNCVLNTFKNLSGCTPSPAPDITHCGF